MSTARKSLPEVGGSAWYPNGWVPADAEDPRFEAEVERLMALPVNEIPEQYTTQEAIDAALERLEATT